MSAGLGKATPEVKAIGSNVTPCGSCMSEDGVASWAMATGCACSASIPSSMTASTETRMANRRITDLLKDPLDSRRPGGVVRRCIVRSSVVHPISPGVRAVAQPVCTVAPDDPTSTPAPRPMRPKCDMGTPRPPGLVTACYRWPLPLSRVAMTLPLLLDGRPCQLSGGAAFASGADLLQSEAQ